MCPADSFENKFQVFDERIGAGGSYCVCCLRCQNSLFSSCSWVVFFFPSSGRIFFRALVNKPVSILSLYSQFFPPAVLNCSPVACADSPSAFFYFRTESGLLTLRHDWQRINKNWNLRRSRSCDEGQRFHLRSHWWWWWWWGWESCFRSPLPKSSDSGVGQLYTAGKLNPWALIKRQYVTCWA